MRIPIREQLGFLVLLSVLIALAVVTIATWISNHSFVLEIRSSRLLLTASLKASQLASALSLMQFSVSAFTTRVKTQAALEDYDNGVPNVNFTPAQQDLVAALGRDADESLSLQAIMFPNSDNGQTAGNGLFNATSVSGAIPLPYHFPNGTRVVLGDAGLGFPSNLYPNLTYSMDAKSGQNFTHFDGETLHSNSTILLGPWQINESYALISITLPVIRNTSKIYILGWLTVIYSAQLLTDVVDSHVGLDKTGVALVIGPTTLNNRFPGALADQRSRSEASRARVGRQQVHFALASTNTVHENQLFHARRQKYTNESTFRLHDYPSAFRAFTANKSHSDDAGSMIQTVNEEHHKISTGFARVPNMLCDWAFVIEESQAEVFAPIGHLRNILLGCVFGTAGGMLLLIFPLAHFSVLPIRRLREATKNSIEPPRYSPPKNGNRRSFLGNLIMDGSPSHEPITPASPGEAGPSAGVWTEKPPEVEDRNLDEAYIAPTFNIPRRVKDGKHWIHDELTDLTKTFNAMSDELMLQYNKLEERVAERTAQLELSKKAAEAANESKTLFIANISHELKTPLNGILGMAAVAMQEEDPLRIRHSLSIIMKSGDLLHNLLTDLLTFSKNQVGQQLSLEEKEFRLRDIGSQVKAIFDKQAREGQVGFSVDYEGTQDALGGQDATSEKEYGPIGTGRVKDMFLWGDQHRILQVVINLVGNSLKFTPKGGYVKMKIRCIGENSRRPIGRVGSTESKTLKKRPLHRLHRLGKRASDDDSNASTEGVASASFDQISGVEQLRAPSNVTIGSDSGEGPPLDARQLVFEFEVADTGPGIPPHLQSRIFEPFVQGDLRLTKKFGGTGLGLSICSQLANLMHGSIKMESEVDVGSTFLLRVPLRYLQGRRGSTGNSSASVSRANSVTALGEGGPSMDMPGDSVERAIDSHGTASASTFEGESKPRLVGLSQPFFTSSTPPLSSPGSESPKKGSKLRVLVAEDNRVNQEVVLRMLRLEEVFDVNVAKDGQEALDLVKESMESESPYDLIFMDVQMPNLDGRQSTRKIREIGYSAPIVALTAFSDEVNQRECLESGMDYFLAKPIRRPALKHVLKTYCPPIQELDEVDTKGATPVQAASLPKNPINPRADDDNISPFTA